jgi:hypothetical protein
MNIICYILRLYKLLIPDDGKNSDTTDQSGVETGIAVKEGVEDNMSKVFG